MMKNLDIPVWLLDVDGVIGVERKGKWPRVWNGLIGPAYLRWAPALVREISKIHHSDLVEIRWCSSWCEHADQVEGALGLPSFARAAFVGNVVDKSNVALGVIRSGRKLIWTDDHAIPQWGPNFNLLMKHGSLLISPDPVIGLQPADIAEIKDYIGYSE
jgi:hypothetical protein